VARATVDAMSTSVNQHSSGRPPACWLRLEFAVLVDRQYSAGGTSTSRENPSTSPRRDWIQIQIQIQIQIRI
jgi:hypothetical protein